MKPENVNKSTENLANKSVKFCSVTYLEKVTAAKAAGFSSLPTPFNQCSLPEIKLHLSLLFIV